MNIRKPPSERDVLDRLLAGEAALPPLRLRIKKTPKRLSAGDAVLEVGWDDQRAEFQVECKASATPKVFADTVRRLLDSRPDATGRPLLLVPYLQECQLAELAERKLSGIDLCGNGVVVIPDRLFVYRAGGSNRFPTYSPIKNVYRKNTSMVGRALLTQPRFAEVRALLALVNRLNPLVARSEQTAMSLGTVSKALKGLEDDLIVERGDGVRLLQAGKLLDRLSENYRPPDVRDRLRWKLDCPASQLPRLVASAARKASTLVAATGLSSVTRYAVMQRDEVLSVYCSRAANLLRQLGGRADDRFPNLEVIETDEQPVYFDAREQDGFWWASPVQTCLELSAGDKRDRETAEQVRGYLLDRLKEVPR